MTHLLVIGGTDSSGGAGLSRDIATAQTFGVPVCPVVTAVTAQTDGALLHALPMPADLVRAQIETALDSHQIIAIKIGMLGTQDIAQTVVQTLAPSNLPIVLDPVLRSTSGGALLDPEGAQVLRQDLLQLTRVVTPNLDELAQLSGVACQSVTAQVQALQNLGCPAVLVKGGHDTGPECIDHLYDKEEQFQFPSPRLAISKRGTGCTLATAIACELARGQTLSEACQSAKAHQQKWLMA